MKKKEMNVEKLKPRWSHVAVVVLILSVILAACSPSATPEATTVPQTAVPPTAVPPTAVHQRQSRRPKSHRHRSLTLLIMKASRSLLCRLAYQANQW